LEDVSEEAVRRRINELIEMTLKAGQVDSKTLEQQDQLLTSLKAKDKRKIL